MLSGFVMALALGAGFDTPYYGWMGHAGNAQHTATSPVRSYKMQKIDWSVAIDKTPMYFGNDLLTHYGTPCITPANTLITPVKINLDDTFEIHAYNAAHGTPIWSVSTDYIMPAHRWTPMCGPTLLPFSGTFLNQQVAFPMAGGRVGFRSANKPTSAVTVRTFYGESLYKGDPGTYNNNVRICTPLTAGPDGSVYFGFIVYGGNSANLVSGLARIAPNGTGSWVSANAMTGEGGGFYVKQNSAPAVTPKGDYVYVACNTGNFGRGYLVKVNASTLAPKAHVALKDPQTGNDALVDDDGTATPTIGPDGDVFVGVLENPFAHNNDRGWMLHFSGDLATTKVPGAFGWDDTASIVPASMVPSYHGTSTYLLCTKYNNYASLSTGNGVNKIGLLDPQVGATEAVSGITTMKEIATVVGVTPDNGFRPTYPNAVREWCVNSAVVDPSRKSIILNSEDGVIYRWDMATNTLKDAIRLTPGIGEAYTCTLIGPDGHIYGVSNARLYAISGSSAP